jgi:F0F1-type ATP synthase alpha subunit
MNIQCIKTTLGEDIIANVEQTLSGDIKLSYPLMIMLIPQDGQYTIGLAPYLSFANSKTFPYKKEHVMMMFEPATELRNEYVRITGQGIVIPKSELSLMK